MLGLHGSCNVVGEFAAGLGGVALARFKFSVAGGISWGEKDSVSFHKIL